MLVELQPPQFVAYQDALVFTFPSYPALNNLMLRRLGVNLRTVTEPDGLPIVVGELLIWAQSNGRLDDLVAGALLEAPNSPKLKTLALELSLTSPSPPSPRLESIILPNVPMVDVASWRGEMERIEGLVCRVEMPLGSAAGSGFLIGPDLVLTNRHVADLLAQRDASPGECGIRLDYKIQGGQMSDQGQVIAFANDWLSASSPVQSLDYAVIRLARATGRGHLPVAQPYDFVAGDVHLILHHPSGSEMKLSAGVYAGATDNPRRVRYAVNTEPGSSGSPVFTLDWRHVALHHRGGSTANAGIPLAEIARDLAATGVWT